MEGTRDSSYKNLEHSYIIYEVFKCNEDVRIKSPLDPDCNLEAGECISYDP